jgi:hypothetical protein
MSSASPFSSPTESVPDPSAALKTIAVRPLRFVAFWTAVFAPLAYPFLLYGGLDAQSFLLLTGVLAVNVLGLLLGRRYGDHA